MKYYYALSLLLLLSGCANQPTTASDSLPETWGPTLAAITNSCYSGTVEFHNLYPELATEIPSDEEEQIQLVVALRKLGFTSGSWARGNWSEGPRIISIELTGPDCTCQVDKLYYDTPIAGKLKVTERIWCGLEAS